MDSESILLVTICIAFFAFASETPVSISKSNSSSLDKADPFVLANCTSDSQCRDLCHKGNFLYSRCDSTGTCICDCSDPTVINSSYTSACGGGQPEGYYWDKCDSYCREEYRRPCRYCTNDKSNFYCTCVCNYKNGMVYGGEVEEEP